jgi:orotidine-5'-phosphate decarboxylase
LANREVENAYGVDFLTVSPFLGAESLEPFIQICNSENKGIFILVRTSNAGNGLIQDAIDANGDSVSEALAHYIHAQASASIGESGYSLIGAVVGATYPAQAARLRAIMDTSLFLVPGFGAQGGSAADILPCFHANGLGAIVNSSRGVLYAHLAHHGNACSKGAYKQSVLTAANAMCGAIYESLHSHFPLLCY